LTVPLCVFAFFFSFFSSPFKLYCILNRHSLHSQSCLSPSSRLSRLSLSFFHSLSSLSLSLASLIL
jgi:hypothetical protein